MAAAKACLRQLQNSPSLFRAACTRRTLCALFARAAPEVRVVLRMIKTRPPAKSEFSKVFFGKTDAGEKKKNTATWVEGSFWPPPECTIVHIETARYGNSKGEKIKKKKNGHVVGLYCYYRYWKTSLGAQTLLGEQEVLPLATGLVA